jgi:3-hydroxyacyl-CoA dehydrogenase
MRQCNKWPYQHLRGVHENNINKESLVMAAHYEVRNRIAVITLNNPPVNGLGHATRTGIVSGIEQAQADSAVSAIVLTGAGKAFSGGADIREFGTPKAFEEPILLTVIAALERSTKPVIAAIHGVAMGGGLELALGCHYRIAAADTQVALPEVKLGIMPGAGGTQRLPRLVGIETALDMITQGTTMRAGKLADTALFDQVIEGDPLPAALTFAQTVGARPGPHPRVRDLLVTQSDALGVLTKARANLAATTARFPAPGKCLDALEAAVTRPFDEGMKLEREAFLHLLTTPESRALRHAFFGERAASKIADVPADTPVRPIQAVGVIGAGTMGSGIAIAVLNAGLPVTLLDTQQSGLDRALKTIAAYYDGAVAKGKLRAEQAASAQDRLQTTLNMQALAQLDLVIEAAFEEMSVKETVFRQLDAIMKPGAILASNTSTLDLNVIAGFTQRPHDVIGLHFFSPAQVMKLLEVVRGQHTGKDVLATAMQFAKVLRKTAVVSGVCDGFIGNRMVEPYVRQAGFLLDEGCTPQQIDQAIERFGFAMGPFRMCDLAGNDIWQAIRTRKRAERPELAYSPTADALCALGRFGQKTGGGWYDYVPGDRTAHPSSVVADMLADQAKSSGVPQRQVSDDEIVDRLVFALVNEGAAILEEGIAAKASDIDMVYLTGYGFPRHRGGPMLHADLIGLNRVLERMQQFSTGYHGEVWVPSPLLVRLAEQGKGFND